MGCLDGTKYLILVIICISVAGRLGAPREIEVVFAGRHDEAEAITRGARFGSVGVQSSGRGDPLP
jgi:hypothetical protein